MFDRLKAILAGIDADYADARHEVKTEVSVSLAGRDLTDVSENRGDGYVLRVLDGGGLASVVFTRPADAEDAARTALANARLIGALTETPVQFAEAPPVRDDVRPDLVTDPRDVPMEEKVALVREYGEIPLVSDRIATVTLGYREIIREKHFVSTEGAEIREDLVTTALLGGIVSADGGLLQNVRVSAGGGNGFQLVRDQHELVEARTKLALDLLDAEPVKGSAYDSILNPTMAGVFAHEAFGHFSEADIIENLPGMREKMKIGEKLGSDVLSIVDDATRKNQVGFYRYDDEGVAVRPVPLITDGVLTGRLHSRRTAAAFGEPVSGHHIAEDYRYAPIVRMGCIFIEPGEPAFEELLARLGNGLYILDPMGGQTAGETFSFGAQQAYVVRGGKVAGMLRDINISWNLYRTLRDIEAVGNDLELSKVGGCGKGQLNPRSCNGGPHILVRNLVVGGA